MQIAADAMDEADVGSDPDAIVALRARNDPEVAIDDASTAARANP